jgi:hypothetical protein
MTEAEFISVNLYKARFDDINMAEATIHNANLQDVTITDANIRGLTIFGFRVDELIEGELDRCDPERVKLRMKDSHDIREVRNVMVELEKLRTTFVQYLRSQSAVVLNNHPGPDRWSPLEHVRHLVFAEDLYLNRWILRNNEPWCKLGFLPPFLYDNPAYADVGTEPTEHIEKVLESWKILHASMLEWVANANSEDLRDDTSQIAFGQQTTGDVLQTLSQHDLQHIRMAEAAITDSTL